jgi:teichuronic acid biosynthesis
MTITNEDSWGLVSIITPTYNCGRFIAETIESVLAQSYQDWELIISDDCSTDDTVEVIRPYLERDARIRYICNERNSGAAVTRNAALREAKGRWIAFLDSDDLWRPAKLEHQLRFMVENGYDFSYTQYSECDENGILKPGVISGPKHVSRYGMMAYCWPGCLTVMYNRDKVGLIQIADIKKNNDYAMWLKVCRKADCHLLPQILATYRRGRSGSISNLSIKNLIKWHYKLFREAEGYNPVTSSLLTLQNLACGFYKKLRYVRYTR